MLCSVVENCQTHWLWLVTLLDLNRTYSFDCRIHRLENHTGLNEISFHELPVSLIWNKPDLKELVFCDRWTHWLNPMPDLMKLVLMACRSHWIRSCRA